MKKIDKIKKFYNKYIGINLYELIFLIIFVVFCFYDTGYTIYKPGGIVNVDTRISGDNLNETNGSFNMAYVSAMKGKTPIYLISKIMPNWKIVKNSDMLPDNETISTSITSYDLMKGVVCTDNSNTCKVTTSGTIKFGTIGKYVIKYTAKDESGNTTTKKRVITVQKNS